MLLSGDQSVSRRHATLCVSEGKVNTHTTHTHTEHTHTTIQPGVVTVTDCKSKFGTTVNGKRMGASEKIALRNDDIITFGQGPPATPNSKFRSILYLQLQMSHSVGNLHTSFHANAQLFLIMLNFPTTKLFLLVNSVCVCVCACVCVCERVCVCV